MHAGDVLEAPATVTRAREFRFPGGSWGVSPRELSFSGGSRGVSPRVGCDCLDWRVHGHVCAGLAPPGQGESNDWRDIPGLRDPAPRPAPAPGDWLAVVPRQRTAARASYGASASRAEDAAA